MMAKLDDLRIEESGRDSAPRTRGLRLAALCLVGISLLILVAMLWRQVGGGDTQQSSGVTRGGVAASAAVVQRNDGQPAASAAALRPGGLTAGGYVEIMPPGATVVGARVVGWVRSVEVIEGMKVAAGQVLATLDDTVHRQALAEAEAEADLARARLARMRAGFRVEEIAEARAQRSQAEVRADFARSEVERLDKLVAIGAATERQLLASRAALAEAEADLGAVDARLELRLAGSRPEDIAVAEADLARAETQRERLRWQVDQCVVRAPIDGVVLESFARVGDWIAPAESGGRQGAILTLFDPGRLQVWVDVNQRDAELVTVGQPVELRADAWRGRVVPGRVAAIMPKANLQRNTVEVKIEILAAAAQDDVPWLRPEMSVQATFLAPAAGPSSNQQPEGGRP